MKFNLFVKYIVFDNYSEYIWDKNPNDTCLAHTILLSLLPHKEERYLLVSRLRAFSNQFIHSEITRLYYKSNLVYSIRMHWGNFLRVL